MDQLALTGFIRNVSIPVRLVFLELGLATYTGSHLQQLFHLDGYMSQLFHSVSPIPLDGGQIAEWYFTQGLYIPALVTATLKMYRIPGQEK